jgi:hypothetical protein
MLGHAALARLATPDPRDKRLVIEALVRLYEARHAAEPDAGYDVELARWRRAIATAADG